MRAINSQPGCIDTIGHSSIQSWSAGEIFPAVIATVETYDHCPRDERGELIPLEDRLARVQHELKLYGRRVRFSTHEEAVECARAMIAQTAALEASRAETMRVIDRAQRGIAEIMAGYTGCAA